MTTALRPRPATYMGLFVLTMTMLAYEVALTRVFSVTMWYHFAFVAISLALFGMTAGALIVHFAPRWFTDDRVKVQMYRFSLAYALSMVVVLVAHLAVPFRVELNAAALASVVLTCALLAVPFTLAGVVVCLALTRFPAEVNRLYAADLVGAGIGCLLLFGGFFLFDGLSLVIFLAAVASVGALIYAVDAGRGSGVVLCGLLGIALLGVAVLNNSRAFVTIIYDKDGEAAATPVHDRWNHFSRITLSGSGDESGVPGVPGGLSPAAFEDELDEDGEPTGNRIPRFTTRQVNLLIDGVAGTSVYHYDGDPASTEWLRYDVSNLHYYALEDRDDFSAVVIGVGGGKDVLSALQFGAGDVTGIEINGEILNLVNNTVGDFSGHVDQDPRVTYVEDEARSWLERSDRQYDSIQISLIDSWAATAAGAYSLTENTLYTVEAWDMFLDRLEPENPGEPAGILSATRFYHHQTSEPLEVIRTVVLATEALEGRGVDNPRDHIAVYEGPQGPFGESLATVMVSPEPLPSDVVGPLADTAEELSYTPLLTPAGEGDARLETVVEGSGTDGFSADVSAPTDDRPFFFQMASLGDVIRLEGLDEDSHIFKGVYSLFFLGLGVMLLAALCIGGPLVLIGRQTSHAGNWPHYLFFSGIGLAFLLVEISQLMRLATFLGHPTYALTVVLFSVLLFSGLGSLVVEKLIDISRPTSLLRPLVALLVVLVLFRLVTPAILAGQTAATTPVRIAVAVIILAPLSFVMGMPFAVGMRAASARGAPTAFLWGINGAMSVVSSVMAMVIAVFFGITMTLYAGIAAYALAAVAMALVVRQLQGAPGTDAAELDGPEGDGAGSSATARTVAGDGDGVGSSDGVDADDGAEDGAGAPAEAEPVPVGSEARET